MAWILRRRSQSAFQRFAVSRAARAERRQGVVPPDRHRRTRRARRRVRRAARAESSAEVLGRSAVETLGAGFGVRCRAPRTREPSRTRSAAPSQTGMFEPVAERERAPHENFPRGHPAADVLAAERPVDPASVDPARAADADEAGRVLLGGHALREKGQDGVSYLLGVAAHEAPLVHCKRAKTPPPWRPGKAIHSARRPVQPKCSSAFSRSFRWAVTVAVPIRWLFSGLESIGWHRFPPPKCRASPYLLGSTMAKLPTGLMGRVGGPDAGPAVPSATGLAVIPRTLGRTLQ